MTARFSRTWRTLGAAHSTTTSASFAAVLYGVGTEPGSGVT